MLDGAEDAFGATVRALLITLLVCAVLAVAVPTLVTVVAARADRPRLWRVFALAFVVVVSFEILAIVTYVALTDT